VLKRIACAFHDIENCGMLKNFQLSGESFELGDFHPEHVLCSECIARSNASELSIPLESDDAMFAILEEAGISFEPIGSLTIGRRLYAGLWLDSLKCRKDERLKR
jgi:hypothetical protein